MVGLYHLILVSQIIWTYVVSSPLQCTNCGVCNMSETLGKLRRDNFCKSEVLQTRGVGDAEPEDDPLKLISDVFRLIVDQLKDDPKFAEKLKQSFNEITKEFSGEEYSKTFVLPLLSMVNQFLENEYCIGSEDLFTMFQKVYNQKPDTLCNNVTKLCSKTIAAGGAFLEHTGSIAGGAIGLIKDEQTKQANYVSDIIGTIPVISHIFSAINQTVNFFLSAAQVAANVIIGKGGKLIRTKSTSWQQGLEANNANGKLRNSSQPQQNNEEKPNEIPQPGTKESPNEIQQPETKESPKIQQPEMIESPNKIQQPKTNELESGAVIGTQNAANQSDDQLPEEELTEAVDEKKI